MLNPQDAEKRLEAFADANHKEAMKKRVAALPEELRAIGYIFLDCNAEGHPFPERWDYQKLWKAKEDAVQKLDEISEDERRQVFAAWYPKLAPVLAAYWKAASQLYQTGYTRKAFRVKDRPDLSKNARMTFLAHLPQSIGKYHEHDIAWFAAWCPYLDRGYSADEIGRLATSAIDAGGAEGDAVFDILLASGRGEHEVGAMGRHVTRGLLSASRADGWEFVEKLLLAAQRQEGLRQNILETVDEAHPEAFRRMIRLIVEHDLSRFSSVIGACDVWFGFGWESPSVKQANTALGQVADFMADSAARDTVLSSSDDGEKVYLALWTIGFDDAMAAIPKGAELLSDSLLTRRAAGAHFLAQLGLLEAQKALLPALDDADLRIAAMAFNAQNIHTPDLGKTDLFERIERNLPRFPKSAKALEPILFPWLTPPIHGEAMANALVNVLGDREPSRLLPYLPQMGPWNRAKVAEIYADAKRQQSDANRDALIRFLSDTSSDARNEALKGLERYAADDPVITAQYEKLLTRKSADLRRALMELLLKKSDESALESAERLLDAKDEGQRTAGLDMLDQMVKKQRSEPSVRALAAQFHARRPSLSEAESALVNSLLDVEKEQATLDNALGLMNPDERTKPTPPQLPETGEKSLLQRALGVVGLGGPDGPKLTSPAVVEILKGLDALVEQYREMPLDLKNYGGSATEMLLGDADWYFPVPNLSLTLDEDRARLPLRDILISWWEKRPDSMRDADGRELLRTEVAIEAVASVYRNSDPLPMPLRPATENLFSKVSDIKYKHQYVAQRLVHWLKRLHPSQSDDIPFLLDAAETTLYRIREIIEAEDMEGKVRLALWRETPALMAWVTAARQYQRQNPAAWSDAQTARLWNLLCWLDQPVPTTLRLRPTLEETVEAFRVGAATEADVYDQLLGPRADAGRQYYHYSRFDALRTLSGRKRDPRFDTVPGLETMVGKCRQRILEVELGRGDSPTVATHPAQSLRYAGGQNNLLRLLKAMDKTGFHRGSAYSRGDDRSSVFSQLIRVTFPSAADTLEAFAAAVKEAKIPEKRLIETAVYAPQWARHIETTLGWPSFAEAVCWMHAHTKDNQWGVDQDIKESWTGEISDKTPLTATDLLEGAVDVAWFHRVYGALGAERWTQVDEAAKYASTSGGHKRAQLFADAMLNRVPPADILARIRDKRNQDAVRSLGLLPLPENAEARADETLSRYAVIQEFVRTTKQFGAQRQESEKKAARIGLENLARTSGYPDPVRLEWAMEARAIADLASGPLSASLGDVMVTLSINPLGAPDLTFLKKGKVIKTLPPAARKDEAIAELIARRKEIERQASRMRRSLEEAMCRGDVFTGAEVAKLWEHPVLQPMLRSLVFVTDGPEPILGYPTNNGTALEEAEGVAYSLAPDTRLRLAHPYDLLQNGKWDTWQRDCFLRERVQPFKQVFRELYILTDAEKADGAKSERYAGHQVNPKQALALLGTRSWVSLPEEGVRRTFHDAGLTAWVEFMGLTFTPADVEGLTLENVHFTRRGDWKPVPLSEIPPRLFSETMRDLDLVVSVAHQGGVDPEASASTVEMREAIVREASAVLKLDNVRFQKSHVLIDGKLATYSVHLGSAIVHRQPGGYVCIVPVHSQHRGRLFLPFADDDPRTAEVVSKVLLLARDSEIKDPTILEQLLHV